MRYLILLCAFVIGTPSALAAQKKAQDGASAVDALVRYCLPAVTERKDPAAYALDKGLTEIPKDQAAKFSPDGGRVFAIPSTHGNAVLIVNAQYPESCAIAVHILQSQRFWNAVDTKMTAFVMMREKRIEEDRITKREYRQETLAGNLTLLVTASDSPRPNGLQALMTLARVQK